MITIKRFKHTKSEYKAYADIRNAIWTDNPHSVSELKHNDENWHKDKLFGRVVAKQDDQMVAIGNYGEPGWLSQEGRYFISILVDPQHQNQGIGGMVFDHILEDLKPRNPKVISGDTRENFEQSLHFLEKRGFKLKQRNEISRLDVQAFDPIPFERSFEKVKACGIEIQTLAELQKSDPDWLQKMYDFDCEVSVDVPSPAPVVVPPIEQYKIDAFSGPSFIPEGHLVAVKDGEYVGYSSLHVNESNPELMNTGFSGTRRSHRRQGICTALKVRAAQFAKDYGAKYILTGNEENNPMYKLNLHLGFEPQPAWLSFEKVIQ